MAAGEKREQLVRVLTDMAAKTRQPDGPTNGYAGS
jgi:hypothetical protein